MTINVEETCNYAQRRNNSNALCMNAKDLQQNMLERAGEILLEKYPELGNLENGAVNFFNAIIQKQFKNGIRNSVFIRNYTLSENGQRLNLAIRLKKTVGDFLFKVMPENKTLLFKGFVENNYFWVTDVSEDYDGEKLPYEVESQIIRYDAPEQVKKNGGNCLYQLADTAAHLNDITRNRAAQWLDYIDWRRNIIKAGMRGAKYIHVESNGGNLIFTLQFESKEKFESERKWLFKRELAAYDGTDYADAEGSFSYSEDKTYPQDVGKLVGKSKSEGREINGHFEIQLTYTVPNKEKQDDLTQDELEDYIQNRVLPRYPKIGFLAPSVIKDLSLLNRLEKSLKNLLDGRDCRSPSLSMWIFDVQRVRPTPPQEKSRWKTEIGNDWLNKNIAANKNQREAVLKMLASPDLCLIQGPPGTGKTTVIAETIYQLAKKGNRILLASQSHDAVDNALDRLADRTEIRAVRLNERESIYDDEPSKFSKANILSRYYSCISKAIKTKFLNPWEENFRQCDSCQTDLDKWQNLYSNRRALDKQKIENDENLREAKRALERAEIILEEASRETRDYEAAKSQYKNFVDMASRGEVFNELYLPNWTGEILAESFVPLLKFANEQGILLLPSINEDAIKRDPNLILLRVSKEFQRLQDFHNGLIQAQKNSVADSGLAQLKLRELDEKITALTELLADEEDSARRAELKKQRTQLRNEKDDLQSGSLPPPSDEILSLFDEERKKQIQSPADREVVIRVLRKIFSEYEKAITNLVRFIGEKIDAFQPKDIAALEEDVKVCKGQLKYLKQESARIAKETAENEKLSETFSQKYDCERDEIETRIEEEISRFKNRLQEDSELRDVWTDTFDKFTFRLEDAKAANYDGDYYLETYLKSCNVVGITCTANMRKELDKIFSDFDVVIIDEVSKATPPELLPPLMRARKAILVGDHRQLPPVFNEYKKPYNELIEELEAKISADDEDGTEIPLKREDLEKYKNMVTSSLFREYFQAADDSIKHLLSTQYRMHSDIQSVINRFYDGRLQSGILETETDIRAHGLSVKTNRGESFLRSDSHAYWIDSSILNGKFMLQSSYTNSTSFFNIFECWLVRSVLQKINDAYLEAGLTGITVGVISFYGLQVGHLDEAVKTLRKAGKLKALKVAVNTVDRFQGKEKQIIITSLVCNPPNGKTSRHIASFERINVAFSRAQNLLIIIGAKNCYGKLTVPIPDMDTGDIRKPRIYQNIIDDIAGNGALIAGDTLIDCDDIPKIFDEYKEAKKK